MLLVRLVNGVSDAHQKGAVASSVSKLAVDLAGLPRWVVDLRHEASHNALPSLSALHLATQDLLTWLLEHFWRPQEAMIAEGLTSRDLSIALNRFESGRIRIEELLAVLEKASLRKSSFARHVLVPLFLDGQPQSLDSPLFCTLTSYPGAAAAAETDPGASPVAARFPGIAVSGSMSAEALLAHRNRWVPVLQHLYMHCFDFSALFTIAVAERICWSSDMSRVPSLLSWMQVLLSQEWWHLVEPGRFVPDAATEDQSDCSSSSDFDRVETAAASSDASRAAQKADKKRRANRRDRKRASQRKKASASSSSRPAAHWEHVVSYPVMQELENASMILLSTIAEMCNSCDMPGACILRQFLSVYMPPSALSPRSWSTLAHFPHKQLTADTPSAAFVAPALPALPAVLSLDDFENLLAAPALPVSSQTVQAPRCSCNGSSTPPDEPSQAWSVVEDWIPCPIGTLPGRLFQ